MMTPADSPSSPERYAAVPVQAMNIQAPLSVDEITASFNAANAVEGAGVIYPAGPWQA